MSPRDVHLAAAAVDRAIAAGLDPVGAWAIVRARILLAGEPPDAVSLTTQGGDPLDGLEPELTAALAHPAASLVDELAVTRLRRLRGL